MSELDGNETKQNEKQMSEKDEKDSKETEQETKESLIMKINMLRYNLENKGCDLSTLHEEYETGSILDLTIYLRRLQFKEYKFHRECEERELKKKLLVLAADGISLLVKKYPDDVIDTCKQM
jgi:hypothetical protein